MSLSGSCPSMSPIKYPTLRLNQVVSRLERFGITAREAKGSELVLEGKKLKSQTFIKYTVGRHKSNREIHRDLLKAILRRFEIEPEDFFEDSIH